MFLPPASQHAGIKFNFTIVKDNEEIQFFTATILEWKHLLKPDQYKDTIVESLRFLSSAKRVVVFAFTIMPNHFHLIWQIKSPHKLADVQRDFLKFTAQQIMKDLEKHHLKVLEKFIVNTIDRKHQIWERNPLTIPIYSREILEQKLDYIHYNPVQEKWKLVADAVRYPYSTMSFYELGDKKFDFC